MWLLVRLITPQALLAVAVFGSWIFTSGNAPADEPDFRVVTRIFAAGQDQPVDGNTTIFQADKVYDFKQGTSRITIVDTATGQATLLDRQRRAKTVLRTEAISQLVDRLKASAIKRDDPLVKFAAQPQFKTTFDRNQLRMAGNRLSFHVQTTKPKSLAVVGRYRRFADVHARLNSIRPGGLPPFARLALNKALDQRGLLPKSIELTLRRTSAKTSKTTTVKFHSEHIFSWRLTDADLHKIETARSSATQFQTIQLAQFLRGPPHQARHPGRQAK